MGYAVHIRVSDSSIHLTIPELGIQLEDRPLVFISLDSRGLVAVSAVGEDSRRCAASLSEPASRSAASERLIDLQDAVWWKDGRVVASCTPAVLREHSGECLVLNPFAPETFSSLLIQAVLRYFLYKCAVDAFGSGLRLQWHLSRIRPHIEWNLIPQSDDATFDELARSLMGTASQVPFLNGQILRVRNPRGFSELTSREGIMAVGWLAMLALLVWQAARFHFKPGVCVMSSLLGIGLIFVASIEYRRFRFQ